ncbi:hypothetical protein [Streptomyces sp. NPDC058326]|uniref:hypothetical protein n=1 Tax=Streptomyces sp. NPDC058326 TaxID=3346447 RepID=UPI0036E02507
MRVNPLMQSLLQSGAETEKPDDLPGELRDLVESGWKVGPADSLVIAGCYGDGAGWRDDWQAENVPQCEFEVNDVSIPCDDFPEERDSFLRSAVARSRAFARAMLGAAAGLQHCELLVAIVSVGVDDDYFTHGATVKFATRRTGFPGVYGDLDRFQYEAMASIEYCDVR